MGALELSETRNEIQACMALQWNQKEEDGLALQDGKRARKGSQVGGARLTIETRSDIPISVKRDAGGRLAFGRPPVRKWAGSDTLAQRGPEAGEVGDPANMDSPEQKPAARASASGYSSNSDQNGSTNWGDARLIRC
jgi:hypothetical protein